MPITRKGKQSIVKEQISITRKAKQSIVKQEMRITRKRKQSNRKIGNADYKKG